MPPKKKVTSNNDTNRTLLWCGTMTIVGSCNFAVWIYVLWLGLDGNDTVASNASLLAALNHLSQTQLIHLGCSLCYTLVCWFRSAYPRIDLERKVIHDHWLSSIFLGRSGATVAEVCYALQLSLYFMKLMVTSMQGSVAHDRLHFASIHQIVAMLLTNVTVPLICVAQVCCWAGLLHYNQLFHALENSLWGVFGAILFVASVFCIELEESLAISYWQLLFIRVATFSFVAYIAAVDVPMYFRKAREQQQQQQNAKKEKKVGVRQPLPISFSNILAGLRSTLVDRVVDKSWCGFWSQEAMWMTPYFSVCVWTSIFMFYDAVSFGRN